jgi:hypothetical protein
MGRCIVVPTRRFGCGRLLLSWGVAASRFTPAGRVVDLFPGSMPCFGVCNGCPPRLLQFCALSRRICVPPVSLPGLLPPLFVIMWPCSFPSASAISVSSTARWWPGACWLWLLVWRRVLGLVPLVWLRVPVRARTVMPRWLGGRRPGSILQIIKLISIPSVRMRTCDYMLRLSIRVTDLFWLRRILYCASVRIGLCMRLPSLHVSGVSWTGFCMRLLSL